MRKLVLEGAGLISGEWDLDESDRRREEERRDKEAAAKREAKQQATADEIENLIAPHVKVELGEEWAAKRPSPETRKHYLADFERFKRCCAGWDLPYLPAPPQAVAVFLNEESERGLAHVNRLVKSISVTHRAADLPDPTEDLLVRAIIRLCRKEEKQAKERN